MNASSSIPLTVLDLASRPAGGTNADALAGSVRLAQAAERLGYGRFWVAEHHGMPAIASSAPAVLIAGIAAATERIRVGSGGVMLPNHAPLVVAEQFGTLRALYGDRIDLGIGRAPGTDGATAMALRRSEQGLGVDDFPQQLLDLFGFFHGGMDDDNPLRSITAVPGLGDVPQIWLLGSSGYSAQVAAALGLPFAFAHHFAGENTEAALEVYRSRFKPSDTQSEPRTMIAVTVVSDEDPDTVRALSLPGQLSFLRLRQGLKPEPVSVEEALAHDFTPLEEEFIAARNARQAIGVPDEVKARLDALLASTEADELMVSSGAATIEGRIRSLEIVAQLYPAA
ncbi:luciferase-like monooxygenase [Leifsonia xyli subsp. cynodontis DSM 46306]|uniref:Luciferase-like domain-containing protein n=1 Tax=Leifsonia xyli subsp. cynodontis DSM 46306 TaxID=1389489 RepID=U3PC53_LEIXC|nr:MsnO8 family LLM class oxidoreductase [Leifsonia xyli]AGW42337.1 luciferase-like monooxygenase [Leifsonia xyli subsp. cynodontis DSM 46306]